MPMKEFQCGTLVPGCGWHTRHQNEAEIIRRATDHLRVTHGETMIREKMVEAIKARIELEQRAA
jgi:predicted small metal-binding protein